MDVLRGEHSYKNQKRIDVLKSRVKRCVCKYCGGKLMLRRIIFSDFEDARVEIFCSACDRIEFGVEPEIYQSAKFFVENSETNFYPGLDDNEQTRQMTIARVAEIMTWENKNIGILDNNGFNIQLNYNENFVGESLNLSEDDLDEEQEEDQIEIQFDL